MHPPVPLVQPVRIGKTRFQRSAIIIILMQNPHAIIALRTYLSLDDGIILKHNNNDRAIGKIVKSHGDDKVSACLFSQVSSEILNHHSLSAVTDAEAPFALKSGMVEVIQTPTIIKIPRSSIVDLAFIVPLVEVESGLFHLTGAINTFFIRYIHHQDGSIRPYPFFMLHAKIAEPVSFRIFRGLNALSSSLKRSLYHQPEDQSVSKSFRLPFCYDSFFFIWSKFRNQDEVILNKFDRTQRITLYFDDLSMKSSCRLNQVFVIRILTESALTILRECLGIGIGIGLGKPRPTKSRPLAYCCMNDIITSIEVAAMIPDDFINNKKHRLNCDGIDLLYTVESQTLQCNVRCTKLVVNTEQVVRSRIKIATVHAVEIVPYVGAMFFFGESNDLCSIDHINDGFALCSYMEEERPSFRISLNDVIPLISSFGHARN